MGVQPADHAGDGGIDVIDPRDSERDVVSPLDRDQQAAIVAAQR